MNNYDTTVDMVTTAICMAVILVCNALYSRSACYPHFLFHKTFSSSFIDYLNEFKEFSRAKKCLMRKTMFINFQKI